MNEGEGGMEEDLLQKEERMRWGGILRGANDGKRSTNIQQQQQRFGAFLHCSVGKMGKFEKNY
jgi:hypothetical protein